MFEMMLQTDTRQMSRIVVFCTLVAAAIGKLQNITVEIGEITCGDDDYLDDLKLQVWDKDLREFTSSFLVIGTTVWTLNFQ